MQNTINSVQVINQFTKTTLHCDAPYNACNLHKYMPLIIRKGEKPDSLFCLVWKKLTRFQTFTLPAYTGDPVALMADFMDSASSSFTERNELAADLKLRDSI